MKCTDKEWDTCRVEKMGCSHCYYDCISKDRIRTKIDILKRLCEERELTQREGFYLSCYEELLKEDKNE